jgi:ATP-dependent helicase/nuclease subunit A
VNTVKEARVAQRRALNPAESVWVAASAGTGKTKVLTDRLLALMLGGTDPARILCLTFTRAAAAEMANRVNDRLAKWTTMPPGALAGELVELTSRNPDEYDIALARQLFARVLDVAGGAKILTIHAFCQSLLSRFPLEAGVPPEFAVLDERGASEALAEAAETVISAARAAPAKTGHGEAAELAGALASVARHAQEERFTALMAEVAAERSKLRRALADGETALRNRLATALSVPPDGTIGGLVAAFCAAGAADEAGLRAAAAALAEGTDGDRQRGAILARWC